MTRVVLALAGKRGSGKTTLALALESRFGFSRASFGDYVRSVAVQRGVSQDIQSLEILGESLIHELGWETFCAAVLANVTSRPRVVVDSIRHLGAYDTLAKTAAPGALILAFVEVNESERANRLLSRQRLGDDLSRGEMTDELLALKNRADIIVRTDQPHSEDTVLIGIESRLRGWTRE